MKGMDAIKELKAAGNAYPITRIIFDAALELEAEIQDLKHSKEDKPGAPGQEQVNQNDLTKGNMQKQLYKALTSAGENEQQIALKIYRFLKSLE
jgi:hypothetical protein